MFPGKGRLNHSIVNVQDDYWGPLESDVATFSDSGLGRRISSHFSVLLNL